MYRRFLSAVSLIFLGLTGCDERELLVGLDSKQSLEVFVALSRAGISADRERVGTGASTRYTITVPEMQMAKAAEVLQESGLPREADRILELFTSGNGLLPLSPELTTLRVDLALARLLERQLLLFPGVTDARVVVRRFDAGRRGTTAPEQSRVAVVIRSDATKGREDVAQMKRIIEQVVPDARAEDVTVEVVRKEEHDSGTVRDQLSPLWPESIFGMAVPEASRRALQIRLAVIIFGSSLICLISGFIFGTLRARTRALPQFAKTTARAEIPGGGAGTDGLYPEGPRALTGEEREIRRDDVRE